MNKCLQCSRETKNKKFCSCSCSTFYKNTHNHSTKGKGKGTPICKKCNKAHVPSYAHRYCVNCTGTLTIHSQNPSKGELIAMYNSDSLYTGAYTYIHWHARDVILKNVPKVCSVCGYRHHVEVHHKIPVSEFSNTAKLNEINSTKNLVILCPNHHWEAEHNILDLKMVGLPGLEPRMNRP